MRNAYFNEIFKENEDGTFSVIRTTTFPSDIGPIEPLLKLSKTFKACGLFLPDLKHRVFLVDSESPYSVQVRGLGK